MSSNAAKRNRKNKKKASAKKYVGIEDEKKEATTQSLQLSGSNNKKQNYTGKERNFYLTKETIKLLQTKAALLVKLKENFEAVNASIEFVSPQIIVRQGKLDNERVLKMVQEVIKLAFSEAEFNRLVEELASIEHPRKELLKDPAKTFSDFLAKTEKGAMFLKHLQSGAPRKQWFSIKDDRLYWRDKEKGSNHLNRSMEMNSIVKIRPGKVTKIFKSNKRASKISEDHCFSIVGVRKTLDLECKSRLLRDEWFTYIEFLHRHYCRA
eukprot:497545_1